VRARGGPRSTWLGRLVRRWRPDRNPLRRRLDRVETAVLGVLLVAFLAGAPLAARAAGSWTHAGLLREARAHSAAWHQVPATLLQSTTNWTAFESVPGAEGPVADVRWKAPDGRVRTGMVYILGPAKAGSTIMVWINRDGQLTDPPLLGSQIASLADLNETLAVTVLAVTVIVIGWLAHHLMDRRRLAAWGADWLVTGPRWSPRR
jgi:hypothetical protein